MELWEALSKRRKEIGMQYTDLERESGLSISTIKKILGGHIAAPSYESVQAIAYAMKMSMAELDRMIAEKTVAANDSPSDADLLQKLVSGAGGNEFVLALARSWLKLDEAQREVLNRFIDEVVEDYRSGRAESALAATAEAVEAAAAELEDISSENQLAN